MDRDGRTVKIWYANDETGWAEHLGGNRYRLNNVPLAPGLNIGDVVLCRPNRFGMPQVRKRVRRRYRYRTAFRYDTAEQYWAVHERALEAGAWIENLVGPAGGKRGLAQCAHGDDFDPLQAAEEVGVENPNFAEEPD